MSQSRQLAAIMFTDIVGYTVLMGRDSNKVLELARISKEIQKPLVEKHYGQWLKEMGDGALVKFGTARDAVNCAIDIQKAARAEFDGKLRISIYSGDVTIENNDIFGDGVNVASRLESIADPGGIYISESIEKPFRDKRIFKPKMRQNQTLDYVQKMHNKYMTLDKPMLLWDALIELNHLMDVRDPDLLISEIRKNKM